MIKIEAMEMPVSMEVKFPTEPFWAHVFSGASKETVEIPRKETPDHLLVEFEVGAFLLERRDWAQASVYSQFLRKDKEPVLYLDINVKYMAEFLIARSVDKLKQCPLCMRWGHADWPCDCEEPKEEVMGPEERLGWICPRCHRVWAPQVDGCEVCNERRTG